jgi:hypothetical protein
LCFSFLSFVLLSPSSFFCLPTLDFLASSP